MSLFHVSNDNLLAHFKCCSYSNVLVHPDLTICDDYCTDCHPPSILIFCCPTELVVCVGHSTFSGLTSLAELLEIPYVYFFVKVEAGLVSNYSFASAH
jgi:hypothetical protein